MHRSNKKNEELRINAEGIYIMLSIMSVAIKSAVWKTFYSLKMNACDTVEAHSCVNIVTKFTDEQYTTIKQSTAGRFDPRVFVNCFPEIHSCTLLQL